MIKGLRASDAHKPFFCYVAHNAVHGPLQAKPEDSRSMADATTPAGTTYARSVSRVRRKPASSATTRRWPSATRKRSSMWSVDDLDDDTKAVFARYMEVYAASIESVDENLGRLLDVVEDLGELENTIVIFMSDNGGTAEGGEHGHSQLFQTVDPWSALAGSWHSDVARDIDLIGGPRADGALPGVGAWRQTRRFASTRDSRTPVGCAFPFSSVGPRD